jgi:hypothetical protein
MNKFNIFWLFDEKPLSNINISSIHTFEISWIFVLNITQKSDHIVFLHWRFDNYINEFEKITILCCFCSWKNYLFHLIIDLIWNYILNSLYLRKLFLLTFICLCNNLFYHCFQKLFYILIAYFNKFDEIKEIDDKLTFWYENSHIFHLYRSIVSNIERESTYYLEAKEK